MAEYHIVEDFKIGNTRIRIADDYCLKTEAETQKLLKEIAQTAIRNINSAFVTEETKTKENAKR